MRFKTTTTTPILRVEVHNQTQYSNQQQVLINIFLNIKKKKKKILGVVVVTSVIILIYLF